MADEKRQEKYPEHEKLKALGERRATVQDFLDFLLDEAELELCEMDRFERFMPQAETREQLMARYFEIDLAVLETEKRAMLDELRKMNGVTEAPDAR